MKFASILALVGITASKELKRLNTYDPDYLVYTEGISSYNGDD